MRHILFVALWLVACGGDAELTPERAGTLAAAMKADPDRAEQILDEAGVSEEAFAEAIYDIAQDPEATEAYLAVLDGGG